MTQDPKPYSPMEAVARLAVICDQLRNYNVPLEHIDQLRRISQRFTRHLDRLIDWNDRLQYLPERFYPW